MLGSVQTRRLVLSLFLGLCITLITVNIGGIFRGAALTPLLDDTVNLPGMLFATVCGSPLHGERLGLWHDLFFLGDLLTYSFIAFIALSVGNARVRRR